MLLLVMSLCSFSLHAHEPSPSPPPPYTVPIANNRKVLLFSAVIESSWVSRQIYQGRVSGQVCQGRVSGQSVRAGCQGRSFRAGCQGRSVRARCMFVHLHLHHAKLLFTRPILMASPSNAHRHNLIPLLCCYVEQQSHKDWRCPFSAWFQPRPGL